MNNVPDADKYSIFKAVDPNSPSVFNSGQPQQQSELQNILFMIQAIDI
jgi:hypothetical protein